MLISPARKIEMEAVLAVAVRSDKKIAGHPFVKNMPEGDKALLSAFLEKNSFDKPEVFSVFLPSGRRVFVLGLGERKDFTIRKAVPAMRKLVQTARKDGIKILEVSAADFASKGMQDAKDIAETMAAQFELANYEHVAFKTAPKDGWKFVEQIHVYSEQNIAKALERGKIIGEEINAARELSNTPGGDMTPEKLAKAAEYSGELHGIKVSVLGEKEMKKLGMGGVLGVGQGSATPPRFIVMEYMGGVKKLAPVVLVGKGITFDSGGLNIKPDGHIYEMHMDMSGGASVIHTVAALARLKAKKNIVGIIPAAENMPSGASYRPGDVLKTMSGKTIEITNTDAEGRVVMADGLAYAQKYNPRLVIDVATLTGAAMVALGQRASAIFTTDKKLENALRETGERTMDLVWPLPLWEEYENDIKGTFGDWNNTGKDKYGGAITAAAFLWQFIKGFPWVHIDIAPRMTSIEEDNLAKGAAGPAVNLLVHFLEKF